MWQKRTVFLESLGCAKNQVDAEVMLASLERSGWQVVDEPAAAELVLVNTCGFIKSAKEEAINVSLQHVQPGSTVVMCGCLSQRYGEIIAPDLVEIAAFFGNRDPAAIVEFVERRIPAGERVWRPHSQASVVLDNKSVQKVDRDLPTYSCPPRKRLLGMPGSAFVKVAEGCRNRCTFCAIPLIRGDLRSRERSEVLAEVRDLLGRGIREIILIAQDLNAFGMDRGKGELKELLADLLSIPGDHWIRPLYVYPDTFDLSMLELFERDERLVPYFDIPFQHGAREVLKRMARNGSADDYLGLIAAIRERLPHAAIRTSILVGFPGETDAHMAELADFQTRAALEWLGVFSYSAEEGTAAAAFNAKVTKKLAQERQTQVEARQISLTATRLDRYIGLRTRVLVEELVEGEDLALGRTFFQAPEVDGLTVVHGRPADLVPGSFVNVRIVRRNGVDMEAVCE